MSGKDYRNRDMQGFKIVNHGTPSSGTDVANKTYVDNAVLGINTPIGVRLRATGNVDISQLNNGDLVDNVAAATNDRVLLDSQSTPSQDGVYVIGATAGSTVRLTQLDTGEDARGLLVVVEDGDTHSGEMLFQTETAVIGTDGLSFTELSAGVTYSADGDGITLTSTTFSLELDGTTLSKSSSGLRVGSGAAGAGLIESNGVLAIPDGTYTTVGADTFDVDVSAGSVARQNSALGPASAGATWNQAHSLGRRPTSVEVVIEATGEYITDGVDISADTTNITVTFGASQADRSAYRVLWAG